MPMNSLRILIAIPHYFGPPTLAVNHRSMVQDHHEVARRTQRAAVLSRTVMGIHQSLGNGQCMMQLDQRRTEAANGQLRGEVRVVICTVDDLHVVDELRLPRDRFEHRIVDQPPTELGFACHDILRDSIDRADWFGYLEDDLWINDAWWIDKLAWFQSIAGEDALLMPNRFERADGSLVTKAYVDGDLAERLTKRFQDVGDRLTVEATFLNRQVRFARAKNPHAGCFFLSQNQLRHWVSRRCFQERDAAFIGPLESAATLGVMRSFRIYKPAIENAAFFEIEHQSDQFISQLRRPKA